MTDLLKTTTGIVTAALLAASAATPAFAAEKWDMPLAYPATNFHSENAAVFAACVTTGTGGAIEIVNPPGRIAVRRRRHQARRADRPGADW